MTQPPPIPPWEAAPEVDTQGNPVEQSSVAPWENAPEVPEDTSFASPNQPVPGHPTAALASGMVKGGLSAINPVNLAKALYAIGKTGVDLSLHPSKALGVAQNVGHGLYETGAAAVGARGPEALGEVLGTTLAGIGTPAAMDTVGSGVARALRTSRAQNIVRAVKGPADLVPIVEQAGESAQLPVSLTQGSLARKLLKLEQDAGAEVGAAKAALPGEVAAADIANRLPVVGEVIAPDQIVTGARPLRRATERTRDYWENVATTPGGTGMIPRAIAASIKEEAGGEAARGGAYAKGRLGMPVAPGAEASASEAAALKGAILDKTGLSAEDAALVDAYEKALAKSSLAQSLSDPAQLEHANRVRGAGGDWKAAMVGRVAIPASLGGLGAMAAGGAGVGAAGALGGVAIAELMKSTLWRTLSAAAKLKAARALESGGLEAFREVVLPAAMADVQMRRRAEAALRAQGEGVTVP